MPEVDAEVKIDNGVWVPKLIKVMKKIVKETQIVPSSSLMYCNN